MMKKIIALALALSMALSMVAFAGYTDAAQINADLAADIELVGALGLMQGNTDGSFNPKGTLTRGEAAVIIYRLHSGKSTIDASWGDKSLSNFSDMNHWSVAYVNYCAALGLIAGYPDGTFRPENDVTAAEMAKMLLNVAGYDTEKQNYGKNWPGAVLADASNAGLFDKYEAAFTGAATREWVAKMVANMLNVKTVVYAYGSYLEQTDVTFGAKYGVKKVTAIAKANEENGIAGTSKAAKDNSVVGTYTIKYDVPTALLGHDVTVYYKGEALDTDAKIYAVVDAAKTVINTTMDQVKYDSAKTTLTVNGSKVDEKVKAIYAFESLATKANPFGKTALKDSRAVELVYNKSSESWYAKYNTVEYVKVEEHKADKNQFQAGSVQLAGGTTDAAKKAYAAVNFVDTVAKGDFVAIETVGKDTVTYNVSKIDALRTKISSNLNNEKFTVGATTYEGAASYADFAAFCATLTGGKDGGLTKTYDIYTDGKYVVFAEEYVKNDTTVAGLPTDVVMLIASKAGTAATAFENAVADKVQVLLNNGSVAVYEYKAPTAKDSVKVAFSALSNKAIYELVLNDDGSVYFKQNVVDFVHAATTKTAFVDATALTNLKVAATVNKTVANVGDKLLVADENSFLFVELADKNGKPVYSVVKVSELNKDGVWTADYKFAETTAYTYNKTTGLYTLAYAAVSSTKEKLPATPDAQATGSDWFLLLDAADAVITEAGTTYAATGVNKNGEKVTLTLTDNTVNKDGNTALEAGKVYTVKSSSKETYLDVCAAWATKTVNAVAGNTVLFAGDSALTDVAADAVIVYVQVKDSKLVLVDGPATLPLTAKVYVKTNDKGVVTAIISLVTDKNAAADVTSAVAFTK